MDANVKMCVDSRKNVLLQSYELTDEFKKELDELFDRINTFASSCTDAQDFETKFMSSDLNSEYTNLYTKVVQNCKCNIKYTDPEDNEVESKGKKILDEATSDAKYIMDDITMPARRQARMKMDSKLRDTPLVKIEQANNMFHLFKRFKRQKPEEINEENK